MGNNRYWLWRVLVIVAIGLLLVSWFLPWWSADAEAAGWVDAVVIHPYGLDLSGLGSYAIYMKEYAMPAFFAPLIWTYLGLVIVALLIGAWIKDKNINLVGRKFNLSKVLISISGLSYIIVAVIAVIVMSIRIKEAGGIELIGKSFVSFGGYEESWVTSRLRFGYWLACGIGPLLLALALIRDKIINVSK